MAITKVSQYNSSPTTVADYQAQNEHLQAFINRFNSTPTILNQNNDSATIPYIQQGAYISMGGTMYVVDTEDYEIQGTVLEGYNYISLATSGDNLIATWTDSRSGYSWNSIYNYYSDGINVLLPYIVTYEDSTYSYSLLDLTHNQKVRTTSDVEFNNINVPTISVTSTVSGDLPVSGNVQASNGMLLQNSYISTTAVLYGDIFNIFDTFIPNNNDILALFGGAYRSLSSSNFSSCFLKRINSTTMYLYYGNSTGGYITITDGDTSAGFSSVNLAW